MQSAIATFTIQDVQNILAAMKSFINQRPALDKANYGQAPGQTPDRKRWYGLGVALYGDKR